MYNLKIKIVFVFFLINSCQYLLSAVTLKNNPTPVVLWHGMGESFHIYQLNLSIKKS